MNFLKKQIIYLMFAITCIFVVTVQVSAETQIVDGGTEANVEGLVNYTALADVTAYVNKVDPISQSYPYWYDNNQNFVPSNIFDDLTDRFWYAGVSTNDGIQNGDRLIVDLKRKIPLKVLRWRVKKRTGSVLSANYIRLRVSPDGINYTDAAQITQSTLDDGYIDIIFDETVSTRYISYDCYSYNKRGEAQKIEAWGPADDTVLVENLLIADKIEGVASHSEAEATALAKLYDGRFGTDYCYVSSETSEKPYIEIELKQPGVVTDVLIQPNANYPESAKNITVKLSDDGETWFEAAVFTGEKVLEQGIFNTIHLAEKNEYRYIRIEKNSEKTQYPAGDLSIAEMRLVKNMSFEKFMVEKTEISLNSDDKFTNIGENVSDINIILTHNIDQSTISSESIRIYADNTLTSIMPSFENNIISISPSQLESNTKYRVVITQQLYNTMGTPFYEETSVSFETGKIYDIGSTENSKLVNAVLKKPVRINENLGMYSDTSLPEYINDGSSSKGSVLKGGSGDAYYFFDLTNSAPVYFIEISERSLGYSNDTANVVIAGSNVMPSINTDGSINVKEMETIYEVSSALAANEIRTVELSTPKNYRYIALYRSDNSSPVCITELAVYAKVSLELQSEPSVNYTGTDCDVDFNVYSYRDAAFNAQLILVEYEQSGKVVSVTPEIVEIKMGANSISTTHSLQDPSNKVCGVLISDDDVPAMLFDGF